MYEELVTWMRYCAEDNPICEKMKLCPFYDKSEENSHYYLCGERMLKKAADAIEELQKDLERSKDFEASWQHEAEEALKKFQVAISNKPHWIPVTERLPKKDQEVLVCLFRDNPHIAWHDGEYWCTEDFRLDEPDDWQPTHWMSLPQPPESEGE